MTRVILSFLIACLCALMMGSCGHTSKMFASNERPITINRTSAEQPAWLLSTLHELEVIPCPANVRPEVFSLIKMRLRNYLVARADNKATSSISQDYTTKVRDLRWEQPSPDGPVYLTWGYVQGGDYNQNGTVGVTDITPLAQNWEKMWNETGVIPSNPEPEGPYNIEEYYSMSAVCDGSVDGRVHLYDELEDPEGYVDDLQILSERMFHTIAGFRIMGATAAAPTTKILVTTVPFGSHVDIPDDPYSMRLSYRVDASNVNFGKYAYYWVQPYDMETVPPAEPNYGSYSDSDDVIGELNPDYDPANLLPTAPEVPQVTNGRILGACSTALTIAYNPGENTPLPITGQTWAFGGASSGSQSSSDAMPTITLTSTAGNYKATVKVTNAFGESATTPFVISVTTNDPIPVIKEIRQSAHTPGEPATFTVLMSQGPARTWFWDFNGAAWDNANPPNDTSTAESPTMTLSDVAGFYNATVTVGNQNPQSPDTENFVVQVGYAPTDVAVIVPNPIALGEAVEFEATWDEEVTSTPLQFTWNFGLAHPEAMHDSTVYPVMVNGGEYSEDQGNNGTLTVTNAIGSVTIPFDFTVYLNEILLEQLDPADVISGEAGDYVIVQVKGHDLAYPLVRSLVVYVEYAEEELAPPSQADLLDSDNQVVWNVGVEGNSWMAKDGWWTPYTQPFYFFGNEYARYTFFYDSVTDDPYRSLFEEREDDYCSFTSHIPLFAEENYYSSQSGDTGFVYNFRLYLPQSIGLGSFDYWARISCYRQLPDLTPLTYYIDGERNPRMFSNEPYLDIHVEGTRE